MASDDVIFKIQRRVGISMIVGLLVAVIFNFINHAILMHESFLEILFSYYVYPLLLCMIPAYLSATKESRILRGLQVLTFFVLGIFSILFNSDEPGTMIEVYFFVCGIILSLQYNYLKKYIVLKAVLFLLTFIALKLGVVFFSNPTELLYHISPILLSLFYFYIIWVAFAEEIKIYVKETKELKQQIDQDQVFVAFGKNVGGVTHNLKNKIMAIQSFNELMAEHDDKEIKEFCQLQMDVIDEAFRLIKNLTMAIKAKQDPEEKIIAINDIIRSVVDLFDSNSQFHHDVSVNLNLCDDAYVSISPLDASQLVENLLRNAWEAKGDQDLLIVRLETRKEDNLIQMIIEDNGVGIPFCENCTRKNCMTCKHFKIGRTTKKEGTGIGMVYIIDLLNKYKGQLKINSRINKGTEIIVSFKAQEKMDNYIID